MPRIAALLGERVSYYSIQSSEFLECLKSAEERLHLEKVGVALPSSLGRAAPKRQNDFLAGRYCAYQALQRAGLELPGEIPIASDRAPRWPEGWVGSITHTEGFAAAAVARAENTLALGIDTERMMPPASFSALGSQILTPNELVWAEHPASRYPDWEAHVVLSLIFSAKESIYKALRPLAGKFFGFQAAEIVRIDLAESQFEFRLTQEIGETEVIGGTGFFTMDVERVHTAVRIGNPGEGRRSSL